MSSVGKKNPGYLVKHDDGRRGIAYNADQKPKFQKEGKVVVQFVKDKMKPDGPKKAVKKTRLTIKGYVD